jgi:hypothetical protein
LAAFVGVFGLTAAVALDTPIGGEPCCTPSGWSYSNYCQMSPSASCEPDSCIHCKCGAAIQFTIPTSATDAVPPYTRHTCSHPVTANAKNKPNANGLINSWESVPACRVAAQVSEHVVDLGWSLGYNNDSSSCPTLSKGNCATEGAMDCSTCGSTDE